ncbi:MAG TPA: methylaspartate mutase, partial [Nitrospirales bacterium]|nr:methylaspartate mutase [Nitrospirales bacterium]
AVDSIFMMPHLGVLSTVNEQAATEVFVRDCMVYLGTCVAPIGQGRDGERCLDYALTYGGGRAAVRGELACGDVRLLPLGVGEEAEIEMRPAKGFDVGAGKGQPLTKTVAGGVVGVLIDGRGRPLQLPADPRARLAALARWRQAVNLYPD